MINQARFSEIIKSFLIENYPEFTATITENDDKSFDCDLRNPTNEFSIWIATYNSEITIGIEDPNGKTDIHTHISCYEEEDIDDALIELTKTIKEIKNGKLILYHSDIKGYQWTNDIKLVIEKKKASEKIRQFTWNKN
ncbi:hypothetical protein [Aequorivita viscosa]|uniref:Uncharacterized protein n=1 Tax=Aequorivita viscosa TaxID=797419 RepID=A0A1M6PVD9_9FLAO|nr:hypothetical protein [Aequorivita viscosa]SDX59259.1 hypothetical protein SAMN05216556_1602 [Aequorivita viscosa]SHK11830.1 hypothetical protein SAMN04487908_1631 [Aequorivita viscosa]